MTWSQGHWNNQILKAVHKSQSLWVTCENHLWESWLGLALTCVPWIQANWVNFTSNLQWFVLQATPPAPSLVIHFTQGLSYSPAIWHWLDIVHPDHTPSTGACITIHHCPTVLNFHFMPSHLLLTLVLFSLEFHTCYRKWYILCILSIYITYNTITDAAHSKKACSICKDGRYMYLLLFGLAPSASTCL